MLLAAAAVQALPVDDPRAKAAPGAVFVFQQACLLRLNVKQAPAAYAAGSDEIGRGVLADTPALKGLLAVDGAGGRGCRVVYTGDQSEAAWRGFAGFYAQATQGVGACAPGAGSADRLTAACASTAPAADASMETRRADLTITRSGAGAQGAVQATLTNVRP